ncbi:MAG TPA: carboxypeptidase regulatory-like domain-containing protein [Vicinamibacteria bacterium]|nr:carboxypeptidase regulatory-like domain-containing protein [Vicinamibacteria bacterium]
MSMRNPLAIVTLAAPLALLACGGGDKEASAPPASTVAAAPASTTAGGGAAKGSASIVGKISFAGTPPEAEKIKVSADPYCQKEHKDGLERRVVDVKDGGVKDVFVYVKSGITGTYPPPTEAVELDQTGCMYKPHIIALQVGQPLKIKNDDETLHNIHPRPAVNSEFNIGQPRKGMESTRTFDKKEVMIPVGCDVHPWMRSYIAVLDHPFFAVTDENGKYEIKGLPPGDYEVEAVHEKLKSQTGKISVKDGEKATLDLSYKG